MLEIEHFIHGHGVQPKLAFGSSHETLRAVLVRLDVLKHGQDEIFVFVGECEEALSEGPDVDDGFDDHVPVNVDLTLEVLEIHRHRHVHCHRCRHVAVEVKFGGLVKKHRFSPATTIEVVAKWARSKFPNLDQAAAAEFVLQIVDTGAQPRSDQHLGELVGASTCSIAFRLVKEVTPQG